MRSEIPGLMSQTIGLLRIIVVLLSIIILMFFVAYSCPANAQEPNLDNADFIADDQFLRWMTYACDKSEDRGMDAVVRIEAAARRAGLDDYGKLVAAAWYESRFKPNAVNGPYRGMLQISSLHKSKMKAMGLDYYSEDDRLEFGCLLFKWRGLQPWGVRAKARRDYIKVTGAQK